MDTMISLILLIAALAPACSDIPADEPLVLPLWPGKAAGDFGTIGPERIRDPSDSPTKDAKWLTNVTTPTITVFRAPKRKNTGTAMIVCPGGGYWNLAWDLEGEEVAAWLNSIGITGIVLKYRVPRRPGQTVELPAPGPLLDAQRAVSLVRSKAKEWDIDPARIGMVGFSAGGHLVLPTAGSFDKRAYEPIDDIDKVSCRPDFVVPCYSGYLITKDMGVLAPHIRIPAGMCPVMLVHATDDPVSDAENSAVMYLALKKAGVTTEVHIFAKGGHGFGVRKSPCDGWKDECITWLKSIGMLRTRR